MTTLHDAGDGTLLVAAKGALEALLPVTAAVAGIGSGDVAREHAVVEVRRTA
jgi:hypothetical protein